jgi:hypothetical protein
MNRTLKLVVYAAIIEMALVALADFAWRHGALTWLPAAGPANPHTQFMLVFAPAAFVLSAALGWRRLASQRPRLSDSHRRYLGGSLKVGAALVVTIQGLYAYMDVTGAVIDRPLMIRGLIAFVGLWMMIQGNAAAKLDPPSGDGAPAPSIWTRTFLRYGWIMVILGLANVVGALALPLPQEFLVWIATGVVAVVIEIAYRRMTRPQRAA